ncbi:MAG TPA: type II toxin-antitoxin system VapC family toxin [Candidatus Thermoplasmatota archaeon]|nr:type II toxin-antitoxin system VapC family toxin [Candidatus Thermoplasmatota archaeon]
MVDALQIRSVSFDTSFLLKEDSFVDRVIEALVRDRIPCFMTATVASELEQLKVWGRITSATYRAAMKRVVHAHATVIDFKNRLLSDAFGQACVRSMGEHHGVQSPDIINDCTILVSALKNGVDLFLSEDFHFTSAITKDVITEVTSAACTEYHQMCGTMMYSIDTKTFLEAYQHGTIDLDVVRARMQSIKKKEKRLGHPGP